MNGKALILLCFVLCSACGFQLRGLNQNLSGIEEILLDCPQLHRNFCDALSQRLQLSGVTVIQRDSRPLNINPEAAETPRDGSAVRSASEDPALELIIDRVTGSRRTVALTDTARAAEYEVTRTARYLVRKNGEVAIEPTTIRQFQSYRFDENSVLGTDREEQQIIEDLDAQLAQDIINRLSLENARLTGPD